MFPARVAVGLAVRQHGLPVRLRGVISGVGFLGSIMSEANVTLTEYYHQLGIIDYNGKLEYQKSLAESQRRYHNAERMNSGWLLLRAKLFAPESSAPVTFAHSGFRRLTGYRYVDNVLQSQEPAEFEKFREYVATTEFKKAVHVGVNATFHDEEDAVKVYLLQEYLKDLKDMVRTVLQSYRLLIYVGQLDPIFPPVYTEEYFRTLEWDGALDFRAAKRRPWYAGSEDEGISGYVTATGNLVYSLLLGAGHNVGFDQTLAAEKMISRFVKNVPL